jgi:chloramphenicol O-acetyltransferase type A
VRVLGPCRSLRYRRPALHPEPRVPAIDLDTWPRRAIHDFFLGFEDPWFNLTAEVEVGPTWRACREHDAPFSLACWFAILRAAAIVPELRMRLRPGGVWLHDRVRVGATALRPDQSFTYVHYADAPTFSAFVEHAQVELAARLQAPGLEPGTGDDAVLHCTVVPWVRFTGIKHARAGGAGDSIPKIALGRATPVGEQVRLPVSLQGHHSLIDGVHAGAFFQALEGIFEKPEEVFGW